MLYKLNPTKLTLEPCNFTDMQGIKKLEKDLEDLIADNLIEHLFDHEILMPIFQERKRQEEPDILALNEKGDLIIFELKRWNADSNTSVQILRYCQKYFRYNFSQIEKLFNDYIKEKPDLYSFTKSSNLLDRHKEVFGLEEALLPENINKKQHLYIVGNGADMELAQTIKYWQSQGLSMEFLPYRIYQKEQDTYFEFFSKPNDIHLNPKSIKGVVFDDNQTYVKYAVIDMLKNEKVIAHGDASKWVNVINGNDYVFLYHKGVGIIAAGKVDKNSKVYDYSKNSLFYDPNPQCLAIDIKWEGTYSLSDRTFNGKVLSVADIKRILGHNLFWARTAKVPYLSEDECKSIMEALKEAISKEISFPE